MHTHTDLARYLQFMVPMIEDRMATSPALIEHELRGVNSSELATMADLLLTRPAHTWPPGLAYKLACGYAIIRQHFPTLGCATFGLGARV